MSDPSFVLTGAGQWVAFGSGGLVAACFVAWTFRYCFPRWPVPLPGASGMPDDPWLLKLVEWERDRVMAAAKGIAATSAGFLTAVITALLKSEIKHVPQLAIVGCLLGAVGALWLAGELAKSTRVRIGP